MWSFGCGSVIGQSHIKRDKPCQDSSLVKPIKLSDGSEYLVASVSDGAGSAEHSKIGSEIVCRTFHQTVNAVLERNPSALWTPELFQIWFELCIGEMQMAAREKKTTVKNLAATALLALISKERAFFFQIGDGGIVVSTHLDREDEAYYSWVFWPDKGEEVNVTTFVTSKNALETAECALVDIEIDQLAMFTDGIEHGVLVDKGQTVAQPFFKKCFTPLITPKPEAAVSEFIIKVLGSSSVSTITDDDKSLVLAINNVH